MSLKSFHIVFVSLSVLTALFLGTWVFVTDEIGGAVARTILGSASYAAGVGLTYYGRYFLRRFKNFSFM